MLGGRRRRQAGALALAPLLGVWLGHTIEYIRVWGTAGLRTELFGSVHLYMLPLGVLLAGGAALSVGWATRCSRDLDARSTAARQRLRLLFRGLGATDAPIGNSIRPSAGPVTRLLRLGLIFSLAQIAIYVLQENLEQVASGHAAPGLAVITGVHSLACLVQAIVAFDLAAVIVAVDTRLTRRAAVATRLEHLARVLAARLRRAPVDGPPPRGARPRHGHTIHGARAPPAPA